MKSKILVVEDSEQIRNGLTSLLGEKGYQVIAAEDGMAGLEQARAQPFDLIITDVNMPKMNGLDMIAKIRETVLNEATPAFVLTTESLQKFADRCEDVGADIWIVKPYQADSLLQVVGMTVSG